ncbi:MAG: hypothetical protein JWP38_1444 [Herbaspirillum sp.]|jgi:predicted methyltransferase|nr:hypothetical protein [Herbaspirillum sp.]
MKFFVCPRAEWALLAAITLALSACASTASKVNAPVASLSAGQIAAIVDSPDRSAADRRNDPYRKPDKVLAFIGVRPGMTALDLSAGGGYTTELLARAVGPAGRVYGQSPPPDANAAAHAAAVAEGASFPAAAATSAPAPAAVRKTTPQMLADRAANPAVANIVSVVRKFEDPVPSQLDGKLDLVTLMFNYHDLGHWGVDRAQMNQAVFAALKPGGMFVIADHSGRPGTGISESGTLHRIEEVFLKREVEAAGFRLADEGDFLRNPADPRDRNTPEPPMPKDGFVLKFVKP